jgi:DNA-binding NtrC family response regulator
MSDTGENARLAASNEISVMVVDDDPSVLRSWKEILKHDRYRVSLFGDPLEAAKQIDQDVDVDVAVVDIRMPAMDGMELLTTIKAKRPEVEVVMMTGFGGVQDAVEAIKRGAYDFLGKPFESMESAELTVRRAAELRRLERRVSQLEREMRDKAIRPIVGQSPAMKRVIELVQSVASSPVTVLIIGESGTGKEMIARAMHQQGSGSKKRSFRSTAARFPKACSKASFSATCVAHLPAPMRDKKGLFASADGGTLFLDEIGDMALSTQVKLLRALQEGQVRPVGATAEVPVDVRILTATNKDLEQEARRGRFREDLYYRLNVVRIDMPPLRDRGEDIALLAHHLLRKQEKRMEKQFSGIEPDAMRRLMRYSWPGNVRQLENAIEQAVVLATGKTIMLADLPNDIGEDTPNTDIDLTDMPFREAKLIAVERFERRYLMELLGRHQTVAGAARAAGLDRSNFRRLLKKHEISLKI